MRHKLEREREREREVIYVCGKLILVDKVTTNKKEAYKSGTQSESFLFFPRPQSEQFRRQVSVQQTLCDML